MVGHGKDSLALMAICESMQLLLQILCFLQLSYNNTFIYNIFVTNLSVSQSTFWSVFVRIPKEDRDKLFCNLYQYIKEWWEGYNLWTQTQQTQDNKEISTPPMDSRKVWFKQNKHMVKTLVILRISRTTVKRGDVNH